MAIVVAQVDKSGHVLRLDKVAHNQVSCGRAFDNDIVLIDPCVEAQHCRLSWDQETEQLLVEDLGARNGLWAVDTRGKKKRVAGRALLSSGQRLLLGKTLLRVYHSSHPVATAKTARMDEVITGFFGHLLVVIALAAVALALELWNQYVDHPVGKHYAEFGRMALFWVFGVTLYSGFWAVLGKNLVQDGRFWFHLSLSFLVLSLWSLWQSFTPWAMFNLQIPLPPALWVDELFGGLLAAGALYTSCLYATRLGLRARLAIAMIAPLFMLTLLIAKLFDKHEFSARPTYSHVLVAPSAQWRSPDSLDTFMSEAGATYQIYDPASDDTAEASGETVEDDSDDANEAPGVALPQTGQP